MSKYNKTLKGSIPFVVVCSIIILVYLNTSMHEQTTIKLSVKNGCVVIPKDGSNKVFSIGGEFFFTPNKFNSLKNSQSRTYAVLPGHLKDSVLESIFGYASYGLHIKGLNPNIMYSIRIPRTFSSCSIFINGKEMAQQGKIGTHKEEEIPGISSSEAIFKANKDGSADIVFNISNFTLRKSGMFSKIILGEVNKVAKIFRTDLIFSSIVFSAIFTVATFLFFLFFFYKQARFVIWFALASIILAIRSMFFYPHLAAQVFPTLDWNVSFIVRYISFPMPIIFFTIFLKKALKICYKIPYIIRILVTSLYALSIIILPPKTSGELLKYYQIFSVFCFLYNILVLLHALIKKVEFAKWVFFSIMILISMSIYDVLVGMNYIHGAYFTPLGSFVSIVLLSIMILKIYSTSIHRVDKLRKQSKEINNSLVRFVPEEMIKLLNKQSIKDLEVGEYVELKIPILSMDVRSFTNRSESLSPQDVFDFLNRYFATIVPIVREYNGIIPKYLGDGFFALFPGRVSSAIECAIKMQNTLKEKKVLNSKGEALSIGIGIDFDDVLLGTVGNIKRMDSIIISAAYKNAENMQTISKKYASSIVISSSVFELLDPSIQVFVRPIQLIKTKSKTPNLLYEVYSNDEDDIRLLKTRSQGYLIEAFNAIAHYDLKAAYSAFLRVISIFPSDPVATQYISMFNKK